MMGLSVLFIVPSGDRVAETLEYPLPVSDGVFIDSENDVILARWEETIYAFSLACPHQNTALRWKPELRRFQCPKHNSKYEPDGTFISGRATRGMDRFAVTRKENSAVVDMNKLYSQKKSPEEWAAAKVRL